MARKKAVREAPLGPPVTHDQHKFGWCNDQHHEGCKRQFTYYEHTYICSCDCHKEKKEKSQ